MCRCAHQENLQPVSRTNQLIVPMKPACGQSTTTHNQLLTGYHPSGKSIRQAAFLSISGVRLLMTAPAKRRCILRFAIGLAVALSPLATSALCNKPAWPPAASADEKLFAAARGLLPQESEDRRARHAELKQRLSSSSPFEFHDAISTLAQIDEHGVIELWDVALANGEPDLRKMAWSSYEPLRASLARKEWVPQVARFAAPADLLRTIAEDAGFDIQVWSISDHASAPSDSVSANDTVAAIAPYHLERLRRVGLESTVLFDTIADWQRATAAGDAVAALIRPAYQSGEESALQVRIAVIDLAQSSNPSPGYSDWLGDGESILMRSDSLIAYLDVFQGDDSPDSVENHIEERYRKRGYQLAGFFTPEQFADEVTRFFPGRQFEAGRRGRQSRSDIALALAEGRFHSYQETLDEFTDLSRSHPDLARVVNLGPTYEGRQVFALKVTRDPEANDSTKPDVLITGCHHAREWISVEPPVHFAKQLINGYATDDAVKHLVDRLQIWIVPIVNPDGLNYSQGSPNDQLDGLRLWRKNRRPISGPCSGGVGVDLNRNYGFQWRLSDDKPCPSYHDDFGASDLAGNELYRGPEPDSELEVKALNALTGDPNRSFRARLDYHNYSELILYPWGHQLGLSGDDGVLSDLGMRMSDLVFAVNRRQYRSQRSVQLYPATGISTDYAYGVDGIPAPFTIEVRPACCDFNIPENEIGPINQENWAAAQMILNWATGPPILASVKAYQPAPDGDLSKLVYSVRWAESQGGRRSVLEARFPRLEPGPLRVELRFSKPMDTAVHPVASAGHVPPFDALRFEPVEGGWRKTIYQGDTWVGETVVPAEPDGSFEWRLSVAARDRAPSSLDAFPETVAAYVTGNNGWLHYEDSGGAGFTGGADLKHVLPPTIREGELLVLVGAPKGGERLAGGDLCTVAWTTPRDGGFVPAQQEIWWSTDGGFFFSPLVTVPGTAAKHSFFLPRASTSQALFRVFARGSFTIFGDTPGFFTIGDNVGSAIEYAFLSSELLDQTWAEPDGSASGPLRLVVNVRMTNRGSVPIVNPFLRVAELTKNNVLLSRDVGSSPGFAARQSIGAGGDDTLSPGESVTVQVLLGLRKKKKFNLSVDTYGVASGGSISSGQPVSIWFGKARTIPPVD